MLKIIAGAIIVISGSLALEKLPQLDKRIETLFLQYHPTERQSQLPESCPYLEQTLNIISANEPPKLAIEINSETTALRNFISKHYRPAI